MPLNGTCHDSRTGRSSGAATAQGRVGSSYSRVPRLCAEVVIAAPGPAWAVLALAAIASRSAQQGLQGRCRNDSSNSFPEFNVSVTLE